MTEIFAQRAGDDDVYEGRRGEHQPQDTSLCSSSRHGGSALGFQRRITVASGIGVSNACEL
jgi:hypothetical protein